MALNIDPKLNPTTAQIATISAEYERFATEMIAGSDTSLIEASVYSSVYSDDVPGLISFTFSHPGTKADHSDWSMSSSAILPNGEHFDSDPPKPWEVDD